MPVKKQAKQPMNRRQFIQLGATATAGLLLAACTNNPPAEKAAPTVALAQNPPTHTPNPPTATPLPTDTVAPQSTTALNTPTSQPLSTATHTPVVEHEKMLIADMTQAATNFFESLDPAQREKGVYAFDSEERFRWHWTTPRNFPRNGLPLREMTEDQKTRAYNLLQASISSMGFEKALNIMSLQNDLGNDPELYYVTVFGMPGTSEPWGWRWEGHHLSRQFTLVSEQVAMMPFFLGSWPTTTDAGLRAMAREEDAALELINSFTGSAREAAIFQESTLTQHITQNAAQVAPLEPVGVLYSDLTGPQQGLVTEIIQTYLGTLPDHMATSTFERINKAGPEQIRFGWAGSLERQRPQYYRLQGPTFLLEFDNSRNGGTHIHSVWRDFERDFGFHLL
jgi:hypothetical protein